MDSTANIFRRPLIRLLAINLAAGIAVALLMVGGLLVLNPYNLRGLILADRAGGIALILLAGGFIITFGSAAMGTAIMTLGGGDGGHGRPRRDVIATPVPVLMEARIRR